jgi:hypothetical protein
MAGESLKVVQGNATGSAIALEAELVIGRSTPGLGSLGGDSEISRVHARVYHDASGQLMVEDLGSTNGTYVNGARISGSQALRSGDQLRVGQTTMTVEGAGPGATAVGQVVPPPAAAPPPPPAAVAATPPPLPYRPAQPPPQIGQPPGPAGPGFAGGPVGGPPGRTEGRSKGPLIALAVVVVIALVVGGLAIGGVFSSSKTVTVSAPAPAPAPAATSTTPAPAAAMPAPPANAPTSGGYPPGIISRLVAGCASSGKLSQSQCACWFNKLHDAYTYPELLVVLRQAKGGSIPPKAVDLLRGCLSA